MACCPADRIQLSINITPRVLSRGSFWVLNPHENHMDPHFSWPWVQWTHYNDLSQAGSNFSYQYREVLVSWWPQISLTEPFIFTRGQFWPSGIVVACVCLCVSVCVRQPPVVRVITHHQFKLGSPNLDHRCKRPLLRCLLFWGWLTLTFKVKFNFKVKSYPILSLWAR